VTTSIRADEDGARELYRFGNEKVDLAFLRVKGSDLAKEITPTDDEAAKYYEQHRDMFREPERVTIEYVSYDPKHFESNVEIPEAEITQEYEANKVERYTDPEEVHVRHVLFSVPPDADAKKRDEIRARAAAVLERAKKGEDFAALAKEASDDKANKDKGGDLGFIRRGRTEEAFENAAFALQPGEVSDIVETRRGFHVIKLEEHKASREKPLAEVRDEIVRTLRTERARNAARDACFADSEKASSGAALAELAKARGLTVDTPPPFAPGEEIRGLPAQSEVAKNAFATPVGQVGPVEQAGGDTLVLFRVTAKNPSHVAELGEIRDKILAAIRDERATEKARERAEALRKLAAEKKSLDDVAAAEKIKVEDTGPFTRLGDYVPRIGTAAGLKKQAFALTKESPIAPQVYVASGDAYVVALKEHDAADMEEFEKKKAELVKRHLEDQRQAAIEAFLNQLKRRARIQVNPSALAAI
jgi:peptidyl-prolyl cis-trans isomerase D